MSERPLKTLKDFPTLWLATIYRADCAGTFARATRTSIFERRAAPTRDDRFGSISTKSGRLREVRFAPISDRIVDIAGGPVRANKQRPISWQ
jgi:hypothetical protein